MNIIYTNTITAEDFNRLYEAVGWGSSVPERVQTAIERTDFLIAACSDEKTIGMARVIQDGLQALIMDVIVIPEYQGQGIGKTMMGYVMEYLNELSRGGRLFVNLMSAEGKYGFYTQFGFKRRPYEKHGPGMKLWLDNRQGE